MKPFLLTVIVLANLRVTNNIDHRRASAHPAAASKCIKHRACELCAEARSNHFVLESWTWDWCPLPIKAGSRGLRRNDDASDYPAEYHTSAQTFEAAPALSGQPLPLHVAVSSISSAPCRCISSVVHERHPRSSTKANARLGVSGVGRLRTERTHPCCLEYLADPISCPSTTAP